MSMEGAAWSSLWSSMRSDKSSNGISKDTPRRTLAFAKPYRGRLAVFVVLSVASAILAVATPVLAGQVVDAIVARSDVQIVINLALLIALVAVLDAGFSLVIRWISANLGESVILDLRTSVFDHVQRMPIAFFTRTRTGALVSRLNNDVIGAQQAFSRNPVRNCQQRRGAGPDADRDAGQVLAGHRAGPGAAAHLPDPGPALRLPAGGNAPGGRQPQRGHEHADDRAVLRAGRHPGQAVRPAGR